jgi:uncharacterized protein
MKGVKTGLILLFLMVSCIPIAAAVTSTGHIQLLAVFQEDGKFKGSPADLQLEIKKGSGRVFLETIPLSKVDTQISTRFAKEMACKFADINCDEYDFFYTIKSPAGIVGGPSAGGAISALTVAMLKDLAVDQDAAMTGSINSGELIGPVGSVKEKIDAAADAGIKKVLVPSVQTVAKEGNATDFVKYGRKAGVEVVPVATLGEALQELTGEDFSEEEKDVELSGEYVDVMKAVSKELCNRSAELMKSIRVFDLTQGKEIVLEQVNLLREAQNLTQKGSKAFDEGQYYSAASYCFGASIKANTLLYSMKNLTESDIEEEVALLGKKIDEFDRVTEGREKETITDLQTYMIVKERVLEARQRLLTGNNDSDSFGYTAERLNSAKAWSAFFGKEGEAYNLDEESLQGSCEEILGEVDERFQYLNLFFPGLLNDLRNNLLTAHKHYQREEYALCIYLASRTKAEANIIVTMLGVKESYVDELLDQKIKSAKRAVTKQTEKGTFPIIAYSYYEYATSLRGDNDFAALLYSEYALELSDLDIYFDKKKGSAASIKEGLKKYLPTVIFIWGLVLGVLIAWIVMRNRHGTKGVKKEKVRKVRRPPRQKRGRTQVRLR